MRAYVGIDGHSQPMLRTLGRKAPAAAGTAAIERLSRRGIFTVCNALLLGPTAPFEALLDEIEAIAAVRGALVHLLPIDARAGTKYAERAERMGLVEGGFLLRHTRCADERTGLMAQLLTSLPTRLAERSVPIALYDLAYNLRIARRLAPEVDVAAAVDRWYRIAEAWNLDQVRVLRAGAARAARGDAAGASR